MTGPEKTAIAMIRCGCSYDAASESTGVSVERIMELWKQVSGL